MSFAHPIFLWLLVLPVLVVLWHWRGGHSWMSPVRNAAVGAARVAALTLLILALAGPFSESQSEREGMVVVLDVSASVSDEALRTAVEEIREVERADGDAVFHLVVFDTTVRQVDLDEVKLSDKDVLSRLRSAEVSDGSVLADGLRLAGSLLHSVDHGRVVVYTDGLETRGSAARVTHQLAEQGYRVEARRLACQQRSDVLIAEVSAPAWVRQGASATLQMEVESTLAGPVVLEVIGSDGTYREQLNEQVQAGRQTLTHRLELTEAGLQSYRVNITADWDTDGSNNQAQVAMAVAPANRVLVIESAESARPGASEALSGWLGASGEVRAATAVEAVTGGLLDEAELTVLSDLPIEELSPQFQEAVKERVTAGMGLLVAGGQRSLGPGGYHRSTLADVLPVAFSQDIERRDPSTTLVVIIDTSGSMAGSRVDLAKEIARLAIGRLKPHDKIGIVEFYGSKRWAAPIQPASNAIDIQRALNRLSAGGGTVILPAIEEAHYALENVNTRTKHVLVLTDGGVESGAFEPLIRRMANKGVTLSTVLVGPGTHSAFLSSLAQWGRGRFYSAPDRFSLPEIILKQPESSPLSPFVEQPATVRAVGRSALAADLDFVAAGALLGYVQTDAKATGEVVLASQLGHPLLTRWQYGRGHVAVWASQLIGPWNEHLAAWDGFGVMMANVCRASAGSRDRENLQVTAETTPAGVRVTAESRVGAAGSSFSPLLLTVTDASGQSAEHIAEPVAPARWCCFLSMRSEGAHRLEVRTQDGTLSGTAAVVASARMERPSLNADDALIEQLNIVGQPDDTQDAPTLALRLRELWPMLSAWALGAFLLSILLRRLPLPNRSATTVLGAAVLLVVVGHAAAADAPAPLTALEVEQLTELIQAGPAATQEDLDSLCTHVQQRVGDLEPLLTYLQQRGGRQGDGRYVWAEVAIRDADVEQAHQVLTSLTQDKPELWPGWARLAQVCEMLGKEQEALTALEQALAGGADGPQRLALQLRQAALLYDLKQPEDALTALQAVAKDGDPAVQSFCGHLAGLYGDDAAAARLISVQGTGKAAYQNHLFRGLHLLRQGRPTQAQAAFEAAYEVAPLQRDRRYSLERVVAASREAETLDRLVQRWVGQEDLSADRLLALVMILREQSRSAEALELLTDPSRRQWTDRVATDEQLQEQLIAVAVESGQPQAAVAAYERLIALGGNAIAHRAALARLHLLTGQRAEALATIRAAAAGMNKVNELLDLADMAQNLALHDLALELAGQAGAIDAAAAVRAKIFEAQLQRRRGRIDEALALLRETTAPAGDVKSMLLLAETLERFGAEMDALALYQQLYELTQAEDTLLRVAWLLEKNKQNDEAYELWVDLWRTTKNTARLRQAKDRLLSLASQLGRLADVAIDLEERLDDGRGGKRELELLVDIYTTARDPISAAEILYEFGRVQGDQTQLMQRLVRVYLSCDMFGRCNSILRRLVEIDPDNAADYYQQIAIIALERQRPREATSALELLKALAPDDSITDEFAAGVLNMVGLPAQAAAAYQRLLAANPDRIEAHLLWGSAMHAAGHSDQAQMRFLHLLETSAEDDLFTVAVDGLINLDAPAAAFRTALRRVYTRIAANPNKVFLYRLAADLLDGLGDTAGQMAVLERAVAVAGQRRGPLLRELMTMAQQEGDVDRMIGFGRGLIGLGEAMPPQVFLDLGEALVYRGDLAAAERAFQRAAAAADHDAIQRQVAIYYEEAGMPQAAQRIVGDLLISRPDDVDLLVRSGALGEQQGTFALAHQRYGAAIDLMLDRLPSTAAGDNGKTDAADAIGRRRFRRGGNVDEITQHFETAVNGLIATTRSTDRQVETVAAVYRRGQEELAALIDADQLADDVTSNRRLHHLCGYLRRLAFTWRDAETADAFDRAVMDAYPQDDDFAQAALTSRLNWGLYERARSLLSERAALAEPVELQAARLARQGGGKIESAELAGRVAPLLIMTGQDAEAGALLRRAETLDADADTCRVFMNVALALEDDEALLRWVNRHLDTFRGVTDVAEVTAAVRSDIRTVWWRLDDEQRLALYTRLNRMAESFDAEDAVTLNLLCWKLAEALDTPFDRGGAVLEAAARSPKTDTGMLVQLLSRAEPSARAALVRMMTESRKDQDRRRFLQSLIAHMDFPADKAMIETVVGLYRAAPRQKVRADMAYAGLRREDWNQNPQQAALGRIIAELHITEAPSDAAVLTVAAVARHNAGAIEQAVILAQEAIDLLADVKTPTFQTRAMLLDLLDCLTAEQIEDIALDLEDQAFIEGDTPLLLYTRAMLLDRVGRGAEARDLLCQALRALPSSRVIRRKCISMLEDAGERARLAQLLTDVLTGSSIMESFEWRTLSELEFGLGNPNAAIEAASKNRSPLGPMEVFRNYRVTGRYDELITGLRRYITSNRRQQRYFTFVMHPTSGNGGIWGYLADPDVPAYERPHMFALLADLPFADTEWRALWATATPGRGDEAGMAEGLVAAAAHAGTTSDVLRPLVRAQANDAINAKDRSLLLRVQRSDPNALPTAFDPMFREMLLYSAPDDWEALDRLAAAYEQPGETEQARAILRWLIAVDVARGCFPSMLEKRVERAERFLNLLEEPQRTAWRRIITKSLMLTPVDTSRNDIFAAAVESAHTLGDADLQAELDRQGARLRTDENRVIKYGISHAALARHYLLAGDAETFATAAEAYLQAGVTFPFGADRRLIDCAKLLAPDAAGGDIDLALEKIVELLQRQLDERRLTQAQVVRSLCLLVYWTHEHGLDAWASDLHQRAGKLIGPIDEHWLWLADAAELTGASRRSLELQTALLEKALLPIDRAVVLLDEIERRKGAVTANQLALAVSNYSNHPAVLSRALAAAGALGDEDAVGQLERRLEDNWPNHN